MKTPDHSEKNQAQELIPPLSGDPDTEEKKSVRKKAPRATQISRLCVRLFYCQELRLHRANQSPEI